MNAKGGNAGSGIRISIDGRGRWVDNVFIERLWRSLYCKNVYLNGYTDGREARAGVAAWIAFCNDVKPHMALGHCTATLHAEAVWRDGVATAAAATGLFAYPQDSETP